MPPLHQDRIDVVTILPVHHLSVDWHLLVTIIEIVRAEQPPPHIQGATWTQEPIVDSQDQTDLYNLSCTGPKTLFIAPSKYSLGERTTVSQFDLCSRLYRELNGCFDGFDWNHTCIAGGFLTGLVEQKYDAAAYENSDIDLFIYGETAEEAQNHFMEVFKFIKDKFADLWVVPLDCVNIVINICTQQSIRAIQLVCVTGISNPEQLINRFDLSHCQIAFDGTRFISTPECRETLRTRQSRILGTQTTAHRLYKAYTRGFSIMIPDHQVYVKPPNTSTWVYGFNRSSLADKSLKEFTLDKLLTKENMEQFAKMVYNPSCKQQYIKEKKVIESDGFSGWLPKYLKSHTPGRYVR